MKKFFKHIIIFNLIFLLLTSNVVFALESVDVFGIVSGLRQGIVAKGYAINLEESEIKELGASNTEQKEHLRILGIGNSFTSDCFMYIYKIATSLGIKNVEIAYLYKASSSIDDHLGIATTGEESYKLFYINKDTNGERQQASGMYTFDGNIISGKMNPKKYTGDYTKYKEDFVTSDGKITDYYKDKTYPNILTGDWDYISIQQTSKTSGIISSYDNLEHLINFVKKYNTTAKLVWNMTWAYQQDSTHTAFVNYNNDQTQMYNAIVNVVNNKIKNNERIDIIVPTGTAIQNVRTSYMGDKLTRDGYHLSYYYGRYIAALTWVYTLTGVDISKAYMPTYVSALTKDIAVEAVRKAYMSPFAITESSYKTVDLSKMRQLNLNFKKGYYNSANTNGNNYTIIDADTIYTTQIFNYSELPAGSVITIASGYRYRPDGWTFDSNDKPELNGTDETNQRPARTTKAKVIIDEHWHTKYKPEDNLTENSIKYWTERVFNVSNTEGTELTGISASDMKNILKIYVPRDYDKYVLPSGLNIIAIDLGGTADRVNGAYGDAALLEQNGNYLLIDAGSDDDNDALIKFLKSQDVKRLSIYLSHYHADHYGKIEDILNDSYFTVDKIYFPNPSIIKSKVSESQYGTYNVNWANDFINTWGNKVTLIKKGSTINIGEATLKVIWDFSECNLSLDDYFDDELGKIKGHFINDSSLVSMVTYKGIKFLTAGDIEVRSEQKILESNIDIKADILKFSHHMSPSSNLSAFVSKVNPLYAYGPTNTYVCDNDPTFWHGDKNSNYSNYAAATKEYNGNIRTFGSYKEYFNNLTSKTNLLSILYNGNILYNISPNGAITVDASRHYHTLTVKYKDRNTQEELENPTSYVFGDRSPYHLDGLGYIKDIDNYVFLNSTYTNNSILSEDSTVTCYYEEKYINVSYSITTPTNQNVLVTITSNVEMQPVSGWTLDSTKKKLTKTYSANASETVTIKDLEGNSKVANVSISNIDKTAPEVSVGYNITTPTNQNVLVTITANEEIQQVSGWTLDSTKKKLTKTYSANGAETVTVKDLAGNSAVANVSISNIDKTVPEVSVGYNITTPTNQNVVVTITSNEEIQQVSGWTLDSTKKKLTKTYSANAAETVAVKDLAGNSTIANVSITNIDKTVPEVSVGYSNAEITNEDVIVTITANEEIQQVSGWMLDSTKKKLTKTYSANVAETVTVKDLAGNSRVANVSITNINKTAIDKLEIGRVPLKTKVEEYINELGLNKEECIIENNKGEILGEEDLLGTGSKIIIGNKEYILMVRGDVNGDGLLDVMDLAKVVFHLIDKEMLTGVYEEAANIDGKDGLDIVDLSNMVLVIVDKISL